MLKTTNIEADMLAKRREYDRQCGWDLEYAQRSRREMDYLEQEERQYRDRQNDKMMIEEKYDYFNNYPSYSRLDNRW